jgi:dihydroorotate dehydrogenase
MFQFAQSFYPLLLQISRANPEAGHGFLLKLLQRLDSHRYDFPQKQIIEQCDRDFCLSDPRLSQSLWGLDFPNPVGLAAGCDKDGIAAGIWQHLGFGLAELGAITLYGQAGNPRPRLFRLPLDNAALNRLGANNLGAQITAQTLAQVWQRQPRQIPIGINLVKSKVTPLEQAAQDYLGSFRLLKDWADYFVVNVSSPNTPGLRSLQDREQLTHIFSALQTENQGQKPLLIKIAPDLEWEAIAVIIELAQRFELAGIIATNTTIRRQGLNTEILAATGMPITEETGGISGQPIRKRSTEIIRFIYQNTGGKLPIIGVGGIFTAEDAWEKITAGATLLQLYTGWIYRGPWLVKEILAGLLEKLEKEGFSNIKEATGLDHRLPSPPT